MILTYPQNNKEVIDAMRGAIGRDITFYSEHTVPCSACSINPLTNTSTNSFCLVCSGVGYIVSYSGITVSAHVSWGKFDKMGWVTGGQFKEGDCTAQIEYTTANVAMIDASHHVIVDTKKLTVLSKILRGVPTLNRVILSLKEEEL